MPEQDNGKRDLALKRAQTAVIVMMLAVVGIGAFMILFAPKDDTHAAVYAESTASATSATSESGETVAITAATSGMPESGESVTITAASTETIESGESESVTQEEVTEAADVIDNEWALFLVNAENPLPADFTPDLVSIGTYNGADRKFDSRAAEYAKSMIKAAKSDGVTLTLVSSYRTVEKQTENFRNFYNSMLNAGHSREEAFALTMEQIAVPTTSEHNAGLAIDFNSIEESFDQTAEYRWLREHAHEYGFIFRYPKDAIGITGIIYEPWHFRFVGMYHAAKIRESGLTLEEYIGTSAGDNSAVEAFKEEMMSQ